MNWMRDNAFYATRSIVARQPVRIRLDRPLPRIQNARLTHFRAILKCSMTMGRHHENDAFTRETSARASGTLSAR